MRGKSYITKVISLMLSIIIIMSLSPTLALAENVTSPLTIVDGIVINCDKNATGTIVIPEGVTSIGSRSFYNCYGIEEIVIPNSVISIGAQAFYGCRMSHVDLPNNLKSIEEGIFDKCEYLTKIVIPENVTSIKGFINDKFYISIYKIENKSNTNMKIHGNAIGWYIKSSGNVVKGDTTIGKDICYKPYNKINAIDIPSDSLNVGDIINVNQIKENSEIRPSNTNYSVKSLDENICKCENDKIIAVGEGVAEIEIFDEDKEISTGTIRVCKPEETTVGDITWLIPQKVKIGYQFCNMLDHTPGRPLIRLNKQKYFENYGDDYYYLVDSKNLFDLFSSPYAYSCGQWNTENDYLYINRVMKFATVPGETKLQLMKYDKTLVGEPYSVTVEEPIIKTNEKSKYFVGDTLEFKSVLENTALENESVVDYKKALEKLKEEEPNSPMYDYDKIVYEPSFTIIEGLGNVELSEGDFSNTLFASEKIRFKKTGTVKIKVKYTQLDTSTFDNPLYSPEKIITINVTNNTSPMITGTEDTIIKVGDKFDAKSGVSATDAEDGDITSQLVINGSVDTSKVGDYKLTYSVTDSDNNTVSKERDIKVIMTNVNATKLVGLSRYSTAAMVSQSGWKTSEAVVLVNSTAMADALCATPFAMKVNAPILLTEVDRLNEETKSEIKRLGAKKVYIIGGTGVISNSVINDLSGLNIDIQRISGKDRYATSLEIAKQLNGVKNIAVVNGLVGLADAVSIAPVAARDNMAILLTSENEGSVSLSQYLSANSINKVYIIGGSGVIPQLLISGIKNTERLCGQNRNETNSAVVNKFYKDEYLNNIFVAKDGAIKTNELIDALSVGVLAAKEKAPVLLVRNDGLSQSQLEFVKMRYSFEVTQIGGAGNERAYKQVLDNLKN